MNFQFHEDGSGLSVQMSGDLNFAANGDFKSVIDRLSSSRGRAVTFDMAGVNHIDSVGLGLLYIAKEEVDSAGGAKIRIRSPQPSVMKLLKLTESDADFEIVA
jgi:anti-anti-sigma factor